MLRQMVIFIGLISASTMLSGYSTISTEQSFLIHSRSTSTLISGGYWFLELIGVSKREILVQAIIAAIDSQRKTQEQFQTALEQFKSVVEFDGGELETVYNQLNHEYQKSSDRANSFKEHVQDVEIVSEKLFIEWSQEIETYQDTNLCQASNYKLAQTQAECQRLITAMKEAEAKIDPV